MPVRAEDRPTLSPDDQEIARRILHRIAAPSGFVWWFENFAYIQSKDHGRVKAVLWPGQRRVADQLASGCTRLVVLKGRQLGISWVLAAYAVWTAHYHPYQNVLLQSQGKVEAQSLAAKAKFIYDHLPEWQQAPLTKANESEIAWGGIYSRILILPATEDSGRGEGTTLVIADEWASHPYAAENWAAIQPTLGAKAQFVGLSTAKGRGNFFHRMYEAAKEGANGFTPLFLSWRDVPGRDEDWYRQQVRELSLEGKSHLVAQEHPSDDVEAFVASGECKFDTERIAHHLSLCTPPARTSLPNLSLPGGGGSLKVWEAPAKDQQYAIGADVARGLDKANLTTDACAAAVYGKDGRCVATVHGRWTPSEYARVLFDLGDAYNVALLAVENNDAGSAVIALLQEMRYRNLYLAPRPESFQRIGRKTAEYGWKTTRRSKDMLISTLQSYLAEDEPFCPDKALFDEMLNFVDQGGGRSGAGDGLHDDRVICHGIALQVVPKMRARERMRGLPFVSNLRVVA